MAQELTDDLMRTVSNAVDRALPRGFSFVLVVNDGQQCACLSPHGAREARELLEIALSHFSPTAKPDLVVSPNKPDLTLIPGKG